MTEGQRADRDVGPSGVAVRAGKREHPVADLGEGARAAQSLADGDIERIGIGREAVGRDRRGIEAGRHEEDAARGFRAQDAAVEIDRAVAGPGPVLEGAGEQHAVGVEVHDAIAGADADGHRWRIHRGDTGAAADGQRAGRSLTDADLQGRRRDVERASRDDELAGDGGVTDVDVVPGRRGGRGVIHGTAGLREAGGERTAFADGEILVRGQVQDARLHEEVASAQAVHRYAVGGAGVPDGQGAVAGLRDGARAGPKPVGGRRGRGGGADREVGAGRDVEGRRAGEDDGALGEAADAREVQRAAVRPEGQGAGRLAEADRAGDRVSEGVRDDGAAVDRGDAREGVGPGEADRACAALREGDAGTAEDGRDQRRARSVADGVGSAGQGAVTDRGAGGSRRGDRDRAHGLGGGAKVERATGEGQGPGCAEGAKARQDQGAAADRGAAAESIGLGKRHRARARLKEGRVRVPAQVRVDSHIARRVADDVGGGGKGAVFNGGPDGRRLGDADRAHRLGAAAEVKLSARHDQGRLVAEQTRAAHDDLAGVDDGGARVDIEGADREGLGAVLHQAGRASDAQIFGAAQGVIQDVVGEDDRAWEDIVGADVDDRRAGGGVVEDDGVPCDVVGRIAARGQLPVLVRSGRADDPVAARV